ncbi:MAG TPA: hypothetical protein VMB26_06050 [Candidatus Binataceae bacterium]|nr:hypothetical protein [Candidatus Binataceae bacterium]
MPLKRTTRLIDERSELYKDRRAAILIAALIFFLSCVAPAFAQTTGDNVEEDKLAREVDDPTAILMQLQLQDLYTPRNFQSSAQTNTIQVRPILPVEPSSWMPLQQIIRPTFKIETLATSSSSSTVTEYGDMELLDIVVSNWPDPKTTGFGWGVGPTFVFPTGRVPAAGDHSWQAGPAAAIAFRGIPRLLLGFIFQNPISFAYTNSSAKPRSEMEFQPRISYTLGNGWYVKSSDSTWDLEWRHHGSTTIPVSLGLGRVWKFSGVQFNPWISGEWTTYRQFTKITPMYTVRFGLTLLFPGAEL